MMRRVLDPADLPPRPDPVTGLPRPPHAPDSLRGSDSDTQDLATAPEPPPGQGPVLACHRPGFRQVILMAVAVVGLIVLVAVLSVLFDLRPIAWVPMELVAVANLGSIVYLRRLAKRTVATAGAEWYRVNGRWVRTYELVEIELSKRGRDGYYLRLADSGGRTMRTGYAFAHRNRLIWDLVYNGILYSVISGHATTNMNVHTELGVPYATP